MIMCWPSMHEAPSLISFSTCRYYDTYSFLKSIGTRMLMSWCGHLSLLLLSVRSPVIGHCGVCRRVSFSSPEPETSAHFKSALRFPQAHSLINIWKFSPC